MRKVSTLFGIIIIVVAIIILFGGVFAWQYYALKSQQSSNFFVSSQKTNQAQTQTAGWKTYKNNDYRFEISYPGKWFEIENPNLYFMQSTDESLFSPFSFDELKKNFDEENQED